jgi:metal transporter CNNM
MQHTILFIEVLLLVGFSAICSGLNVSLLSLDIADLRRQAKLGNKAAKRVLPLRKNSYLSVAAIVLSNVGAVSATSLVLDQYLSGLLAGLIGTLLIVVFAEVFPQALFTRKALRFCSIFAPLLKFMIFITYPVAKPLQLLMDKLFGKGQERDLQSRRELGLMITEHLGHNQSELDEDEVEIIRGALMLSEKRVRDIMTPIKKVYWLTPDTIVDSAKIDEIKMKSWSRIPVLNKARTECVGVLLMKDLVDIDFNHRPMRVDELPLHHTPAVGSMTALDTMFRKFISARSHLIPIEKDDWIVGIVTIEDLIEEILGHEIIDETDRALSRN